MSDPKPKDETETPEGLETEAEAPDPKSDELDEAAESPPADEDTKLAEDAIEDAEVVPDEDAVLDEEVDEIEDTSEEAADEITAESNSDLSEDVTEDDQSSEPERESEPPETSAHPTPQETKSSGFFGTFLGGVIAAGLGFIVCYFLVAQGVIGGAGDDAFAEERAQIEALQTEIAALREDLSAGGEDPRVGPLADGLSAAEGLINSLQSEIDTVQSEILAQGSLLEGIGGELKTVTDQIEAIAEIPASSGGGANTAAVAALQAELEAQQAENAEMQSELQEMAEAARDEMEEVRARAGALQAETQAAVDEATNRAALANLTSALESGTPLAPALAALTGDAPEALTAVSDAGVLTVLELQNSFPSAARAGLSDSLKVTVGDAPGDRIMAFLQAQVGARSLEAREGDDPDAILARAQEAVTGARFSDALNEVAALPPEGQAAMADWIANAQAREDAVAARDALAAELMSN